MKNKTCLVTGCAGFIGSHITEKLLKSKNIVIGLDNLSSGNKKNMQIFLKEKNFIFYKGDLKNIKSILNRINKLDYIFHFAGNGEIIPSIENPISYFENNSFNTAKLIDFIKEKKFNIKKFVYAASSTCYGKINRKTNEKAKINIEHPYAFSKYVGEQICLHWGKIYKIPVISIRIFNAYGPRSRTSGAYGAVIGVFLKQKLSGYPLTIVGKGNQKRDFLYISDLVDAFIKVSKSRYKNEIFNLGYGNAKKVKYLADLISSNQTKIPWRAGEPMITEANIEKIKKAVSWNPKIHFKKGINIVLTNIDYWKNAPLWTKKKIKKTMKNWNKFITDK